MIEPYYDRDGIRIYHGDCRDVLPHIGLVDLVLTDPPYGIDFDYGEHHDDDPAAYGEYVWSITLAAEALVCPGGVVAVYQSATTMKHWAEWFPRDWRPIAITKSFVQMRPALVQPATDYVIWWQRPPIGRGDAKNWQPTKIFDYFHANSTPHTKPKGHPCPRPLDGVTYLVSMLCRPGGMVLDPFLGSGTTAIAARLMGRRCVGIEKSERYCEIAVKRLQQSVLPLEVPA